MHKTVCHDRNFVNPVAGFHTKCIERVWQECKAWLRRSRASGPLLQRHLDEVSGRLMHSKKKKSLLAVFFQDVQRYYTTNMEGYFEGETK